MTSLVAARVRARRASRRLRLPVTTSLVVMVVGLFLAEVLLGSYTVTLPDAVRIVAGADIPGASFIVMQDKLPRAAVGVMVGVAFGVAGCLFTSLLRNPLASPDVIGVSSGASAGAVLGIVVFGASGPLVSLWAFAGTGVAAALIFSLSGVTNGTRLVLVGISLGAVLQSVVSYLLVRADIFVASDAFAWLQGSLNDSSWPRARDLAVALAVLLPGVALLSGRLGVLALGDDAARALGVPVTATRLSLMSLGVALAAVATAAAGPIAFVAFLSAPIARRLLPGRVSARVAGLVGAVIVLASDYTAHNLMFGATLPVGVVTGALGAPFLIYLLTASHRSGRGG